MYKIAYEVRSKHKIHDLWETSYCLKTNKKLANDLLKLRLKCLHFLYFSKEFAKQKCNPSSLVKIRKMFFSKCLKVLSLGCFILQMSQILDLSFNSKNLRSVRIFSLAFPHVTSKGMLKKLLKTP